MFFWFEGKEGIRMQESRNKIEKLKSGSRIKESGIKGIFVKL